MFFLILEQLNHVKYDQILVFIYLGFIIKKLTGNPCVGSLLGIDCTIASYYKSILAINLINNFWPAQIWSNLTFHIPYYMKFLRHVNLIIIIISNNNNNNDNNR